MNSTTKEYKLAQNISLLARKFNIFQKLPYLMTLIIFGCLSAAGQSSDKATNEIEGRALYFTPTGAFSFSGNVNDQPISFDKDINLPNRWGFEGRYTRISPNKKHKFEFDYTRSSFESSVLLSRTITFLNQTYTANLAINAKRKLQSFGALYAYRWGNEKVRFGPMGEIGVVNASVDISAQTNNAFRSSEGSITKFAGLIGYDLDLDPSNKVNIFHNLGWIVFQGQHLFQTEVGARYFFTDHVGVSGGYQFTNFRLERDNNFIQAKQASVPFVGGVYRF